MSLSALQDELTKLIQARDAILGGAQSYTVNGQTVNRASLQTILDRIDVVQSRIETCKRAVRGLVKAPLFMD